MNVLFVAGFGPITRDSDVSQRFYRDTLGIRMKREDSEYAHTEELAGVNQFALWSLSQAAQSCFGTDTWPDDIPVPQAWVEFDVENVENATNELKGEGYRLFVETREEPWDQIVTRLPGPDGLLIGITHTPWMRGEEV
jgi:catechol 2,3-dioxygenase-like lactoylglutathione lyase family enzyme